MTPNPPDLNNAPLGKRSDTPAHYDPSLLFPMPRSMARDALALGPTLPFMGADFWTGYELSWLNAKGKPQVGILQVSVPCETPFIIESKSFKLYLNSLNNHRVPNVDALTNLIANDVNPALWGDTTPSGQALVKVITPEAFEAEKITTLPGLSIDRLDIEIDHPLHGKYVEELWEHFVKPGLTAPTFVIDFPVDTSPLTRDHRSKSGVVEKWDLYIKGFEQATGYSELVDPVVQRERFVAQMELAASGDPEAMKLDEEFLKALEFGMPPSGGMGLGIDRLLMSLTGLGIRETILFPLVK
jgi:NADPH-dependent 7-cyano-7-deazaguanine reductase QueF-like protein